MPKNNPFNSPRSPSPGSADGARAMPRSRAGTERPSPQGESERVVQMGDRQLEKRRSRIGDFR
ncbi:MAG: hypothetical protein Q7T87_15085 [Polaromonas sp.]|nr:hypothetical protein [Polaromonas sp.]